MFDVRHLRSPLSGPAPIDPIPLVDAERKERIRAIENLSQNHYAAVQRIEQSIRDITVNLKDETAAVAPKPAIEPTLKQRAIDVANELFGLSKR